MRNIFQILRQHRYIVREEKCVLAAKRIEYLGHFISAEGVSTYPQKNQVIRDWPAPQNINTSQDNVAAEHYLEQHMESYYK